ncbi:MAG: biopolymer transporter ExbD [Spirochaetes bacterium]|nr:biopolymer transporter ExbD [Spirochaetota bacterium]
MAFLLIVFFIVIAVFNINKGFILGLPQKGSTKIVNVEEIIKVSLDENNDLLYKDRKLTLDELKILVSDRLEIRPNMTFLLKIKPETAYQNVVNIVDMVRELDVENFSFAMIEE